MTKAEEKYTFYFENMDVRHNEKNRTVSHPLICCTREAKQF